MVVVEGLDPGLARPDLVRAPGESIDHRDEAEPRVGEEPEERGIANTVKKAEISEVLKSSATTFAIKRPPTPPKIRYVSIQYKVKMDDLERVRRAKKKPSWSATAIGSYTFQYFLERECS
jgi:hypothetical protein